MRQNLKDALDNMIFRWDTCLENYREHRSACRDGIQQLTEKGIHYEHPPGTKDCCEV